MKRLVNVAYEMDDVFQGFQSLCIRLGSVGEFFQIKRDAADDAELLTIPLRIIALGIEGNRHVMIRGPGNLEPADHVRPHHDVGHPVRALKSKKPLYLLRGLRRKLLFRHVNDGAMRDIAPSARRADAPECQADLQCHGKSESSRSWIFFGEHPGSS